MSDSEALVGRADGAIVVALFGLLWVLGCVPIQAGVLGPILLAASAVFTTILVAAGLRLRRAAPRPSRRVGPSTKTDRIRKRFRLIGVIEGLAIGLVVLVCARLGRLGLIPASVALVVGLHFFPLATLFRVPLYRATGAVLCLVAVATPILASLVDASTMTWQVVPGLGAATILWTTSAVLVVGRPSVSRRAT